MEQAEKARLFLELHGSERPLVLPNAWDVASARIFEDAGFPAIATTSAGIANLLGYADGQKISRDEMLGMVARIASAVRVPVTADMEAGYGDVAPTARGVIEAGAVGFNLEDAAEDGGPALFDIGERCEAIARARDIGVRYGVPLVINARTDVFLSEVGRPEHRLDETLRRLRAYGEAGADSLFAPGLRDPSNIRALAAALDRPLNILVTAGSPSIADLREWGVARVTIGSGAMRAVMGLTQRIARELRDHGSTGSMTADAMTYAAANALFRER